MRWVGLRALGAAAWGQVILLLICASLPITAVAQQSDERRPFLEQISQHLFGANEPEMAIDGGRKGWAVLMLAPPWDVSCRVVRGLQRHYRRSISRLVELGGARPSSRFPKRLCRTWAARH